MPSHQHYLVGNQLGTTDIWSAPNYAINNHGPSITYWESAYHLRGSNQEAYQGLSSKVGGNQPLNTMPPYVTLNPCIKIEDIDLQTLRNDLQSQIDELKQE